MLALHHTATFAMVFSVVLVILIVALSAVQDRDARCQDRVGEVAFDSILRPSLSRDVIYSTINDVLATRHCVLDVSPAEAYQQKTKTLELLDTPQQTISGLGFRLLKRSDGNSHRYELRAIFDHRCGAVPTVSMEVLPNVDYERVTYRSKTIVMSNDTMKYMFESSLISKDAARINSFDTMQILFPGFHQVSSTSAVTTQKSWSYTVGGAGTVYFEGQPLDLTIQVQQWFEQEGKPVFWRVSLSTDSIFAEPELVSIQNMIRAAFVAKQMPCSMEAGVCDTDFDIYFR